MKKQRKQLIIMAAFLGFLIVAYFGLDIYNDAQTKKEEEEQNVVVTDFDYEEVVAFSYDYNDETLSFTKTDDEWVYDAKPGFDVDESVVESMLETAGSLLGEEVITEYETVDTYGLDNPQKRVCFTMSDGTTVTIQVGDYNDIVGLYYLMIEDDENLYMVDSTLLYTFEVSYTSLEYIEEETEEEVTEETEEIEAVESTEE